MDQSHLTSSADGNDGVSVDPAWQQEEINAFLSAIGRSTEGLKMLVLNAQTGKGCPMAYDLAELNRLNQKGFNIYLYPGIGGTKNEEITEHKGYFAEKDDGTQEEQLAVFRSGPAIPTVLLTTGGKSIHGHWVATEPITDMERWKTDTQRVIHHYDADPACKNPARAMRMPGFRYWWAPVMEKGPDGRTMVQIAPSRPGGVARIIEIHPESRVNPETFIEALLPLPPTTSTGNGNGNGNDRRAAKGPGGGAKGDWIQSGSNHPCPICGRYRTTGCSLSLDRKVAWCFHGGRNSPPLGLVKGTAITGFDGQQWYFDQEADHGDLGRRSLFFLDAPKAPSDESGNSGTGGRKPWVMPLSETQEPDKGLGPSYQRPSAPIATDPRPAAIANTLAEHRDVLCDDLMGLGKSEDSGEIADLVLKGSAPKDEGFLETTELALQCLLTLGEKEEPPEVIASPAENRNPGCDPSLVKRVLYVSNAYRTPPDSLRDWRTMPVRRGEVVEESINGSPRRRLRKPEDAEGVTPVQEPTCARVQQINALRSQGAGQEDVSAFCSSCFAQDQPQCGFRGDIAAFNGEYTAGRITRTCGSMEHVIAYHNLKADGERSGLQDSLLVIDEVPQLRSALVRQTVVSSKQLQFFKGLLGTELQWERHDLIAELLTLLWNLAEKPDKAHARWGYDVREVRTQLAGWMTQLRAAFGSGGPAGAERPLVPLHWIFRPEDAAEAVVDAETGDVQLDHPLLLHRLLSVAIDPKGAISVDARGAVLYERNEELRDALSAAKRILVLDGTADPAEIGTLLGCTPPPIVRTYAGSGLENVSIEQVSDLGRMGSTKRSDSQKRRLSGLRTGMADKWFWDFGQLSERGVEESFKGWEKRMDAIIREWEDCADCEDWESLPGIEVEIEVVSEAEAFRRSPVGVIDSLAHCGEGEGGMFSVTRGSNAYGRSQWLQIVGPAAPNIGATKGAFVALRGLDPADESGWAADWSDWYSRLQGEEYVQAIHRLRPVRRPQERLHVQIVSDVCLDGLELPVTLARAAKYGPKAAGGASAVLACASTVIAEHLDSRLDVSQTQVVQAAGKQLSRRTLQLALSSADLDWDAFLLSDPIRCRKAGIDPDQPLAQKRQTLHQLRKQLRKEEDRRKRAERERERRRRKAAA